MGNLWALLPTRKPRDDSIDDLERGRGGRGPRRSPVGALERQSTPRVSTWRSHEGSTDACHVRHRTTSTRGKLPIELNSERPKAWSKPGITSAIKHTYR